MNDTYLYVTCLALQETNDPVAHTGTIASVAPSVTVTQPSVGQAGLPSQQARELVVVNGSEPLHVHLSKSDSYSILSWAPVIALALTALGLWNTYRNAAKQFKVAACRTALEHERIRIQSQLSAFYFPMLSLLAVNKTLYSFLRQRIGVPNFSLLIYFLSADEREGPNPPLFSERDPTYTYPTGDGTDPSLLHGNVVLDDNSRAIAAEIVEIDRLELALIETQSGQVEDSDIHQLLAQAAAHIRIIALASTSRLRGDHRQFLPHVFPKGLDSALLNKKNELVARLHAISTELTNLGK